VFETDKETTKKSQETSMQEWESLLIETGFGNGIVELRATLKRKKERAQIHSRELV